MSGRTRGETPSIGVGLSRYRDADITGGTSMTRTDERPTSASEPSKKRPRSIWAFGALAIVVLLIGLVGGGFQGKLADVQKNDNSSFLPSSADSTKVYNESQKFTSVQTIPGFIVYQRDGGLTAADKTKIFSDVAEF